MKKKKYLKNQKRQAKRSLYERKRKKLPKKRERKKPILKRVTKKDDVPLKVKIRYYIYKVVRWIKRAVCVIGIHDWKLCSGKEGDPMYTCIKCWKGSKIKWGPGGSTKHYDEKMKEQKEIADPKNWEKKEGKYYFKGKYVKLSKEETRRLEIILKGKNAKR